LAGEIAPNRQGGKSAFRAIFPSVLGGQINSPQKTPGNFSQLSEHQSPKGRSASLAAGKQK
jgi:hypothetical protein